MSCSSRATPFWGTEGADGLQKQKRKYLALLLCVLCLVGSFSWAFACGTVTKAADFDEKLEAAQLMDRCMAQIRGYEKELEIPFSPEDRFRTGLMGPEYTGITTTLGPAEAKRTTADPNMAALAVQLLHEAGVHSGDRVAAAFSGSFPGLNLAVLSACAAMDVDLTYMTAVGSSTHGATWPGLTFPEIAARLVEDGLLPENAVAWSFGGHMDCGLDLDSGLLDQVYTRMARTGIPLLYESNYEKNVAKRMELLGPAADCFVGVGGNMAVSGRGERDLGYGVLTNLQNRPIDAGSGLVERFGDRGTPVVYLLNIKSLAADYGFPYDPQEQTEPGSGALYEQTHYPALPCVLGLVLACASLGWGFHKTKEDELI